MGQSYLILDVPHQGNKIIFLPLQLSPLAIYISEKCPVLWTVPFYEHYSISILIKKDTVLIKRISLIFHPLCMTLYDSVWLSMTLYDYAFLSFYIPLHSFGWFYITLYMTLNDFERLLKITYDYTGLSMNIFDFVRLCNDISGH